VPGPLTTIDLTLSIPRVYAEASSRAGVLVQPGIFISYRRDDSAGFAGRLYDRLASRYGTDRIFMDIDTIRPGHDFAADIAQALSGSAACIVLMGRRWESITLPAGGRRLDDPTDFVRLEVAAAIRRGITVIPVLVEGASPPSAATLPEELRALAGRQAIELSSERWSYDVGRLELALDEILGQPTEAPPKTKPRKATPPREEGETRRRIATMPVLIAAAAVVLSLAGVVGWLASRGPERATATSPTGGPSATSSVGSDGGECSTAAPSLPQSSGGRLSGSYDVRVTLTCQVGELQGGSLWGERDPHPGVSGDGWDSQTWHFSPTESGAAWTFVIREVRDRRLDFYEGGSYKGTDLGPRPICRSVESPAHIERDLYLSVSGEPMATAFEGWLVISWRCDEPFVARFEVTGARIGD
jgi:TIR domain-containing protein